MPTISIFIRKDDLPKWQALENKSEWLHNKLDGPKLPLIKVGSGIVKATTIGQVRLNADKASNGLCKIHGLPLDARGRCLQKGCKYA